MCCVIHSLRNQTPMRPATLRAHWCKSTWSMLLLLGGLEAKGARVSTSTPPLNSAAGGGTGGTRTASGAAVCRRVGGEDGGGGGPLGIDQRPEALKRSKTQVRSP